MISTVKVCSYIHVKLAVYVLKTYKTIVVLRNRNQNTSYLPIKLEGFRRVFLHKVKFSRNGKNKSIAQYTVNKYTPQASKTTSHQTRIVKNIFLK